MPFHAIHNEQLISIEDIYKHNIDKTAVFQCYHCDGPLHFRQSRNGDNDYSEHFYHPNTIKDTHVECETVLSNRCRNTTNNTQRWHFLLSNYVKPNCREVIRCNPDTRRKHIVDAYDSEYNVGYEFQHSPITPEDIQSRDCTTELDWIFNAEGQYVRKVKVGNFVICEIPSDNWERAVKAVKHDVFLYTGTSLWIRLKNRESYYVEVEGRKRHVWIGEDYTFDRIDNELLITNVFTEEGTNALRSLPLFSEKEVFALKAKCTESMRFLDDLHREYVKSHHKFTNNSILAIPSVAGSGKTTVLLDIARNNPSSRILYLAFNASIVDEVKKKSKKQGLNNIDPRTFDSLAYKIYELKYGHYPNVKRITPQTIGDEYPWLKTQPYELRKKLTDMFNDFCRNVNFMDPVEYADRVVGKRYAILNTLWEMVKMNQLNTYESLRKICLIKKWFEQLNKSYDLILVDETQDFDPIMLKLLLEQVTVPRVFVGDPRQSIYEWRGSINGFDKLPSSAMVVEFYSTYRIGNPACEEIRQRFTDCWMFSKADHETFLTDDNSALEGKKVTHLFRTWRTLLEEAKMLEKIYIPQFEELVRKIYKIHENVSRGIYQKDVDPEDLPMFLKKISRKDLDLLVELIRKNLVTPKECIHKLQTIHSYKGLEDDYVRLIIDSPIDEEEDEALYYVALTRGRKCIVED
jgi:hypothetical protein